jgi:hypothetical protein
MESRSNLWHSPKGRVVAGPVRPTFHGEREFSRGIWAAVNSAALGVGIADDLAEAEAEAVGVVEGEADGEVVGSSVTVSVATGLLGAFAFAGSSSRETEQPAPTPTTAATASAATTERYRVMGRVPGRVVCMASA